MKVRIAEWLAHDTRVIEIVDFGSVDETYPTVAQSAGEAVAAKRIDRAILVCGTGLGVCITANKVPGVRAAVAHESYSLERSILSNNCQVVCFGSRIIAAESAVRLVDEWLNLEFDPTSRSAAKVQLITNYESRSHEVKFQLLGETPPSSPDAYQGEPHD
jgi:ribose 5-phosphate isomerase B